MYTPAQRTVDNTGSLTDAYVKLSVVDANGRSHELRTGVVNNSLDPVFRLYLAFPFAPLQTDVLEAKLKDYDVVGTNDRIGELTVKFSELIANIGKEITVPLKLRRGLKSDANHPYACALPMELLPRGRSLYCC